MHVNSVLNASAKIQNAFQWEGPTNTFNLQFECPANLNEAVLCLTIHLLSLETWIQTLQTRHEMHFQCCPSGIFIHHQPEKSETNLEGLPKQKNSKVRLMLDLFSALASCKKRFISGQRCETSKSGGASSQQAWWIWAPISTKKRTISKCPLMAATCKGVDSKTFAFGSNLAPAWTKTRAASTEPRAADQCMAVQIQPSVSSVDFSLSAPASTKRRRMAALPLQAAQCKGVMPKSSILMVSKAAFSSTKNWTISKWLWKAASSKGVIPQLLKSSIFALARAKKRTTSVWPW